MATNPYFVDLRRDLGTLPREAVFLPVISAPPFQRIVVPVSRALCRRGLLNAVLAAWGRRGVDFGVLRLVALVAALLGAAAPLVYRPFAHLIQGLAAIQSLFVFRWMLGVMNLAHAPTLAPLAAGGAVIVLGVVVVRAGGLRRGGTAQFGVAGWRAGPKDRTKLNSHARGARQDEYVNH